MKKLTVCLILVLLTFQIRAQLFDSIASSLKHKPKFLFKIETQNTFINNYYAAIFSLKFGLHHKRIFKYGIGVSRLRNDVRQEYKGFDAEVNLSYFSPFLEYSYLYNDRWEASIQVQFGLGSSYLEYENNEGQIKETTRHFLFSYEPVHSATYRVFKYFGVGAGFGVRIISLGNPDIERGFSSPIYLLRFKVYLNDFYNRVFKNQRL